MREQSNEEREKRTKKSFAMNSNHHRCTVIVHLQISFIYLHTYTSNDVGVFWVKICKIEHFLYFANMWLLLS